ncbi:MAG TPA: sigma factor-like helix-turn-helix DNA-binding protein [Propionicimonas sp.]|nr:sigma factor-like helix-turn-helix DNA-binding protein [Propionicimonas sp.]HRA05998.1 sigma factor-like helix-turn-helix DNA-binding protein [Propionicimonas sp.]
MNVDDLRTQFHDLVVTACEWRAMGLADPHDMAAEVFSRLDERKDHGLQDLYKAIEKVVFVSFQRHAERSNLMERLRGGAFVERPTRTPGDNFLKALSNLRGRDREILQYRFWDELTDAETAEVTGITVEQVRERLATAGTRYLAKLSGTDPGLNLSDIADTLRSIKPGIYGRYGMR